MTRSILHLANLGVEVFRIDAVPYIWKQLGTTCLHLLFHSLLDLTRGNDVLHFHAVDLDAPLVGGLVQNGWKKNPNILISYITSAYHIFDRTRKSKIFPDTFKNFLNGHPV